MNLKRSPEEWATGCLAVVVVIALVLVLTVFGAWVLSIAWNMTMPYLFELPTITPIQALALWVLGGIIRGVGSWRRSST